MPQTERACVLMSRGGIDSTLAALRLSKETRSLTLVTVTSDHLVGVDAVRRPLLELRQHLAPDTQLASSRSTGEIILTDELS